MKGIIISVIFSLIFIFGMYFLSKDSNGNQIIENVKIVEGVQIIEIKTKGGYFPEKSFAKEGIPTVLRFVTNNTFDCSLALNIPSENIKQILPNSGQTDFNIGIKNKGTLRGSCSMGMYLFEVEFNP